MEMQLRGQKWTRLGSLEDGEGAYGKLYYVLGEDGTEAVAKVVLNVPAAQREAIIGDQLKVAGVPHIVPVIDSGEHHGDWVMIMPRAEKSLARLLRERGGPLEIKEALEILVDLAAGLVAIRTKIVHRDVKPENILLLGGIWCFADFGVARHAEAETATATRKLDFPAAYGAPEQWRHEHATSAVDVYAFGIIAYQLLSGETPFQGPTREDFREQHLAELPPELEGGTPRLQRLIQDCLQKLPEARPSAAQVLTRLQRAGETTALSGARRLGTVADRLARRRAQWQADEIAEREEADRRARLFMAAVQTFPSITGPLIRLIEDEVPDAGFSKKIERHGVNHTIHLDAARLEITIPRGAGTWYGPFTVVAAADIQLEAGQRTERFWRGRSHSFWYCDAHEPGRFAWYETAFMASPLTAIDLKLIG